MRLRGYVGPDFHRVGSIFGPDWQQEFLDYGEGVEVGLALVEERTAERPTLKEEVITFMEQALQEPGRDLGDAAADLGLGFGMESWSWRRTLERILERYGGGPADAEVVDEAEAEVGTYVGQRFLPPHLGRFTDEATADEAATLVLRQHEQRLRSWAEDTGGGPALLMRADVGKVIGELHTRDGDPEPTSYVTVLMWKTDDGQPFIRGAYPERPPEPHIAAAYPDLPDLFAAHFGQDWTDNAGTTWGAEYAFQTTVQEPQAQRIRDQLDALLASTSTQDEMHAALVSLGSSVLPVAARQWVARIRGRMDPTIWHPEGAAG